MTAPAFRRGAEAAAEASKGTQFAKTHFFSIDDGESAIVRFTVDMDDWIVVDQHGNVKTRPRPDSLEKDAKWPDHMGAVCRKDTAFGDMFKDCYVCDSIPKPNGKPNRPSGRSWGLGCLREEVKEDGRVVGYRDQKRMVATIGADGKPTGEEKPEKAIVVFNMGFKNFLVTLRGYAEAYGTLLDRDYRIKRTGTELDTTYTIIPLDPIPGHDLRDPETAAKYDLGIDLAAEVTQRASDEYFARFFDIRQPVPESKKSGGDSGESGAPAAEQSKPNTEMDEADLAALASRVKGHDVPPAPAQEPAAAAAGAPAGVQNFNDD